MGHVKHGPCLNCCAGIGVSLAQTDAKSEVLKVEDELSQAKIVLVSLLWLELEAVDDDVAVGIPV